MQMWVQSPALEYPLEKEMTTHPSILAWGIPWTEEPGELPFMGPQTALFLFSVSLSWI